MRRGHLSVNTRSSLRFRAELVGELVAEDGAGAPLRTLNVSTGGVLAHTGAPVNRWDQVSLKLPLPGASFETQAVCVRVAPTPPHEAAFYFLDPDPHQRLALMDFLQDRFESYA